MPATDIADVKEITPERIADERGYFSETFRSERWPGVDFIQDNESFSAQAGTLRGLHFQAPPVAQAKLLRCVGGAAFCIALDIRRASPTYGCHAAAILSAESGAQVFVPSGFAQGILTLAPNTLMQWKVSAVHAGDLAFGVAWDDPALGIEWPLAGAPILSQRDRQHPRLNDLPDYF